MGGRRGPAQPGRGRHDRAGRGVVNQATDLQSRIKEARDSQRRIAVLPPEAAQFAGDVRDLCQRVASD